MSYRGEDVRLRRVLLAISALGLIAGGSGAASADTTARPERTAIASPAVNASSADRPQIVRPDKSAQELGSCDQARERAAAEGKSAVLCVVPAVPSKTPKAVARAAAADGATWCEGQQLDVVHITRTSICENQVADAKLIVPQTGEVVGEAWLTINQQIDTKNTDVNFGEDFFLRVQAVTGALINGFAVEIKANCAPTAACGQGAGPWTGPAPVKLLTEKEGTWQRYWKKTTGFDTLMLEYTLKATYANAEGSYSWGVSQNSGWQVRCDKMVANNSGCVINKNTPTLVIPARYNLARQYIGMVQASMSSHPGWEGKGQPLHRESNETVARKNRDIVCDSTFTADPSTPTPAQCDEFPFAKSKESGAQQGEALRV